jgi:hypothetical protein
LLLVHNPKDSFGLRNRPLEWNDYYYRIFIPLFGRGIFLAIVISIGITIPLGRGMPIPLKNERNRLHFFRKN